MEDSKPEAGTGLSGVNYTKENGKLVPTPEYLRRYLRSAYRDLLTGPAPPPDVSRYILSQDWQAPSLVIYPYSQGIMKAAALILMRLKVASYRVQHTHYLVDVFVDNSEDDGSLSSMYAPFFLLVHGVIPTPNRRLMDLIQEFAEYKLVSRIPFLILCQNSPDRVLVEYFQMKGLPVTTIRGAAESKREVF